MKSGSCNDASAHRGLLAGLAAGAVLLPLLWYVTTPAAPRSPSPPPIPVSPIDHWAPIPLPDPDDAAAGSSAAKDPARTAAPATHPIQDSAPPPSLPLRFLGKTNSGKDMTVVLFGSGRTLNVRGLGPVENSEYVIDDLQESFLVLRDSRLGTSQLIAFTPPAAAPVTWSPEDSQQD